jgi:lysylphosphatidylglycerol synthetase-like protein (DUF2156 family)
MVERLSKAALRAASLSLIIAMVPVMAVSRAVLVHPMAMVAWMDAERPVDAADRATDRAADYTANRTGGGIALRRSTLHSSNNALSLNRNRDREQSRNRGKLQNFQHLYLQGTRPLLYALCCHPDPSSPRR